MDRRSRTKNSEPPLRRMHCKTVIRVFIPWRGFERRSNAARRVTNDRRSGIRFEVDTPNRRCFVDRRAPLREADVYRITKFNRRDALSISDFD